MGLPFAHSRSGCQRPEFTCSGGSHNDGDDNNDDNDNDDGDDNGDDDDTGSRGRADEKLKESEGQR